MTKIQNSDLIARNLPSQEEMLEMVNVDILPFFDHYNEEDFSFAAKYRAVEVAGEVGACFTLLLDDESTIEVPTSYFQFPGTEKENALNKLKNILS